MALVAVVSVKNGPGGSTTLLALSAAWQNFGAKGRSQPLVVEADPAGGDWMLRFGAASEPGLATLATAARHGDLSTAVAAEHAQVLVGGTVIVVAPDRPDRCRAALEGLAPVWAQGDWSGERVVLADCGRLGTESAVVEPLLAVADAVVVVCRGSGDSLAHAATAAERLRPLAKAVLVAVVGESAWSTQEIIQALGVDGCRVLPHDEETAAMLHGARFTPRFWHRRPSLELFHKAGVLVRDLEEFLAPPAPMADPLPEPVAPSAPEKADLTRLIGARRQS
jgi:MinD-like ATPase involved in chromosome partitioning or flagellar assembly